MNERIYCLERLEDGIYLALNRNYKPYGHNIKFEDWVEYIEYKDSEHIYEIPKEVISQLSWSGDTNEQRIYLYNDKTNPMKSRLKTLRYNTRLGLLSKYKRPATIEL